MQDFKGRVAVVTGGGGVLGTALARRFAREGMRIVIADLDAGYLEAAEGRLRNEGAEVLAVQTSVSTAEGVQHLADAAVQAFGGVHVLCNNIGVNTRDVSVWTTSEEDWRWALDSNLWPMIHAARVFVPLMLEQDTEAHIVNTASTAGLAGRPGTGSYVVTKAAVIALTEVLYHELARIDAKVGVSVLLPHIRGAVTRSVRPVEYRGEGAEAKLADEQARYQERLRISQTREDFKPPDEIAEDVLNGIRERRFYIITRPDIASAIITARARAISAGEPPTTEGQAYQRH